jgi:hypothetical protein
MLLPYCVAEKYGTIQTKFPLEEPTRGKIYILFYFEYAQETCHSSLISQKVHHNKSGKYKHFLFGKKIAGKMSTFFHFEKL